MSSMEDQAEPVSPQKRRRRPSVRLGEIGFAAPYHSSPQLLEPAKRRKHIAVDPTSSAEVVGKGRSGGKPPRTRPLEHVAADKKPIDEEWSVVEPSVAVPEEQKAPVEAGRASTSGREQQVRPRSSVNGGLRSRTSFGLNAGGRLNGVAHASRRSKVIEDIVPARPDSGGVADVPGSPSSPGSPGSPKEDEELTLQEDDDLAKTSSDSQELFGSASKGDELPADSRDVATSAEVGEGNPNSHGDEMQGAIEDGPGQANLKSSILVKQDEGGRKLGRSMENSDRAGQPSTHLQAANGTTALKPRVSLATGVRGWLQALGLGKYSEMFELNEVDNEVLPLLTMEDLREMGVGAVGARRKMFTAIQDLGQVCGV